YFILIHTVAVKVIKEYGIPVKSPVFVPQIEHGSGMRMASASFARTEITCMRPAVTHPMDMICNGFYIVIGISVKMISPLALVTGTLDHMIKMRNYTYCSKCMSVIIEIKSPGITCAVGKHLKFMAKRMVSPYSGVNLNTFFIGSTWFTYV